MEDFNANLYVVYGIIDDVKIKPGNWSVKVLAYPQPEIFLNADNPYRYGGEQTPSEENKDGYGQWITMGEPAWVIAQNYGADNLKGQFVEVRYRGNSPWYGQAFIINQPETEDTDYLMAEETGPMRILSANTPII